MTFHCLQFDDLSPGMDVIVQYRCRKRGIVAVRGEFIEFKRYIDGGWFLKLKRHNNSIDVEAIPTAIIVGVSELEGVNT